MRHLKYSGTSFCGAKKNLEDTIMTVDCLGCLERFYNKIERDPSWSTYGEITKRISNRIKVVKFERSMGDVLDKD